MKMAPTWDCRRGMGQGIAFLRANVGFSGEECLAWPLSADGVGYGVVSINGKNKRASRVMCELVHGPAPSPKHHAAHSCGKGHQGCVSPKHLSWKTPKENAADSVKHGTARFGVGRKAVQLSQADYRQIMALKGIKTQPQIGKMFNVSWRHVGKLHRGVTWVDGKPGKPGFKIGDPRNIGWRTRREKNLLRGRDETK